MKRYWPRAEDAARAALRRGPLVRRAGYFHSGFKPFAVQTIQKLIESGEAVRIGSGVVHADHIQPAQEAAE